MKRNLLIILAILLIVPLLLCSIFKLLPFGSIGPLIPITGLVSAIMIQYLLAQTFIFYFKKGIKQFVFILVSMFASVFLAILGMNLFIWLTIIFDIMDYQLM